MSAGALGVVDSPWKDEARASHTGCKLIVPEVVAKLEDESLQESPTRPVFVAQLIKRKKIQTSDGPRISKEGKRTNPCPRPRATDIR